MTLICSHSEKNGNHINSSVEIGITAIYRYTPAAITLLLNNIYGLYPAFCTYKNKITYTVDL